MIGPQWSMNPWFAALSSLLLSATSIHNSSADCRMQITSQDMQSLTSSTLYLSLSHMVREAWRKPSTILSLHLINIWLLHLWNNEKFKFSIIHKLFSTAVTAYVKRSILSACHGVEIQLHSLNLWVAVERETMTLHPMNVQSLWNALQKTEPQIQMYRTGWFLCESSDK